MEDSGDLRILWGNERLVLGELPDDLPEPARTTIEAWAEWADEAGYRMDLDGDGRILLVSSTRNPRRRRELGLIARTAELFDRTLPAPAPEEESAPEDEPPPKDPGEEDGSDWVSWSSSWGTEDVGLDTETIVLLVLRDESDYAGALELLAKQHPYLADWAAGAQRFTGFVLERPLAGAYVMGASGMEEWNPDNELVNRTAQLLLLRRFGQLPYWLVQGWAWHVELELLGGIYCFPWRTGFVGADEHRGWDRDLSSLFESRCEQPLRLEELAGWPRGRYSPEHAKPSWGAVEFLVRHRAEAFPGLLEALRRFRAADNRVDHGDGTWERRVDYEIPLDVQGRLLEEQAGEGFLGELTSFFRLGKRYRAR